MGTVTSDGRMELLERSREVEALDACYGAVSATSHGRLVLVGGEAGVGKTVLLRRFCERCDGRTLWGSCEPLFTPRPLGPLLDVAELTGGDLAEVVAAGDRPHEVVVALIRELRRRAPAVLVLEDLHWADEATLDVVTLLAGRIADVQTLVLASYRDDELDRAHPLQAVLGAIVTAESVSRRRLLPLSAEAVATLAKPHGVDADALYRRTSGNPFFVTEVLGAAGGEIPPTVRDAVLARMARLRPAARTLLDAAAIAPPPVPLWLLEALAGPAAGHLDECLAAGMLATDGRDVAFRHELARMAVEESLPAHVRTNLHRRALTALAARPGAGEDAARLAHHADAAGDGAAVLRYAPDAAVRAASVGAHREAAAQYARALRFADDVPLGRRAELLDGQAAEYTAIGEFTEAIKVRNEALEVHRTLGDRRKQADALRALSWLLWSASRPDDAERAALDAVDVLAPLAPGREVALAYCALSDLALYVGDIEREVVWATRALKVARRVDDSSALLHARANLSAAAFLAEAEGGADELERSLEAAREAGLEELAASAFCVLAFGTTHFRAHSRARSYIARGIDYCTERDLDGWRPYLVAMRAQVELAEGRWDAAAASAMLVLAGVEPERLTGHGFGPSTAIALAVLGRVRARRGDPGQWTALDEALTVAAPSREPMRLAPVAAGRAEAAWLEGRPELVAEATEAVFDLLRLRQRWDPWWGGELASWRARGGIEDRELADVAEPYALQLAGDWRGAADCWTRLGCPYEAALALAEADDERAVRRALEELQRLDAQPAAAMVARRLRRRGATGLPRGPRPSTRANPANLTARELEVLALVAQGLRNAEIAERLFLSERTVAHHVSAILRKLDVSSRSQASAAAVALGLNRTA